MKSALNAETDLLLISIDGNLILSTAFRQVQCLIRVLVKQRKGVPVSRSECETDADGDDVRGLTFRHREDFLTDLLGPCIGAFPIRETV